jgi:hypothetical protein
MLDEASNTLKIYTFPMLTCFIRYQVDPEQWEAFRHYAHEWGPIIPRCGGKLLGYFVCPDSAPGHLAWGLIGFNDMADYDRYRSRLLEDEDAQANFAFARASHFILHEERTFFQSVEGTTQHP